MPRRFQNRVEEIEPGAVNQGGDQAGVVERAPGQAEGMVHLESAGQFPLQAFPRAAEDPFFEFQNGVGRDRRAVGPFQGIGEGSEKLSQPLFVVPDSRGAFGHGRVSSEREEALGPAVSDEGGDAFVEGHFSFDKKGVVGDLVQDRGGELHRIGRERRGE
jgi:hypothetical protein